MRRGKVVVTRVGNPVGSQLFELDPVTTDRPAGREIAVSADEANQRLGSDAGPWNSREFLSVYISGYVDGEGCFTVSIAPRATLLVGWEVRPSFSVSQNGDRAEVLRLIQSYFACGRIRPDRSDRTLKWETRCLDDLVERVIPHFVRFPLLSGKRLDFERFASVCKRMASGMHRTKPGLVDIVEIAAGMNPSGSRRYRAEEIIAQLRQGEGIVCASGNGGST
jgi:LAGLIDADG endonuclease